MKLYQLRDKSNFKTWLGILFLVITLSLLGACAPTGGDTEPTATAPEPTPTPTPDPDPEPTGTETAVADADAAALAAAGSSGSAMEAYEAAKMAGAMLAIIQTGRSAYDDAVAMAMEAYESAKMQAAAAKKAYEDAKNAEELADAIRALIEAENARDAAAEALETANSQKEAAETAADGLVMVDGNMYSVGDISITDDRRSHTSTDGQTITGLLDGMNITHTGEGDTLGLEPDAAAEAGTDRAAVSLIVGITYDSSDDSSRLTLVNSYLAKVKERRFIRDIDTALATAAKVKPAGIAADTDYTPFTPAPADTDLGILADSTTTPPKPAGQIIVPVASVTAALGVESADVPAAGIYGTPKMAGSFKAFDEKTTTSLYYIESGITDNSLGAKDDGIDQTRIYLEKNVVNNVVTYAVVHMREVTIEKEAAYKHINFGLWNSLSGSGGNTVSSLGIGFITALEDGMGMTEEMPNHGDATYQGNYVANVKAAHVDGDGVITRKDGAATLKADFGKDTVEATLTDLIVMEGAISGNRFSGNKASVHDTDPAENAFANTSGLAQNAKLEGSFNGGFFGELAAEAGGVFSFTTDGNEDGAVTGAFGGQR